MFYLGNRSGLRTGEAAGLRMSNLDFLHEGVIRVRFSWDGPLKEGRGRKRQAQVGPGRVRRHRGLDEGPSGAPEAGWRGSEDLVFPFQPAKPQNRRRKSPWTGYRKEYIEASWERRRSSTGLTGPHDTPSVSRNLKNGASLDEVSAALGALFASGHTDVLRPLRAKDILCEPAAGNHGHEGLPRMRTPQSRSNHGTGQ